MIVVADTSPLNYLILIHHIDILPPLFGDVIIPPAVQEELYGPLAPPPVRAWISNPPAWLEIRTPGSILTSLHPLHDAGEREAITLAQSSSSGALLLIDELLGRREASRLGLEIIGTLGILQKAHQAGLLDMQDALERLRSTNFKISETFLQTFRG